jgi:predicted transposase/invertase (TIGR01784 family)
MRIKDKYISPLTDFDFKFEKLFKQAEIANYSEEEYQEYEHSLKVYRDLKNTIDTAYQDGISEGILRTAKNMKQAGVSIELITQTTGLSVAEIEQL